jgi:hypothetical protein
MNPKGYLIFHLNLAFSSIEEEARTDVIKKCYYPLLELVKQTGIPIGLELTGWTLKQIVSIDPEWVEILKSLLKAGKCELIGSGYSQIIGPIVPYQVNKWNQELGIQEYRRHLNIKPNIVLVNELAYSNGLVDLYAKYGYEGFIMDRDNVRLALELDAGPIDLVPTHALGLGDTVLPILWADSILFQKIQHYTHGEIAASDYLDYIKRRIGDGETLMPIYCNDAEVFDYRPGRFVEERSIHDEGEWNRFQYLLENIPTETGIEWVSPTKALSINNQTINRKVSRLTTTAHPIPVKKQAKYNISRWAVTGRDDLWLNTMCHRIEKFLSATKNKNPEIWRELCELWGSDLRTHITQKRWQKATEQISRFLTKFKISKKFGETSTQTQPKESLMDIIGQYGEAFIDLDKDGIILRIYTKQIQLELNLRKGLTIHSLAFASHGMEPCIGTLQHGYFKDISLGADYYSGGVIIELPTKRKRITDLEQVHPLFSLNKNGNISVCVSIKSRYGIIKKTVTLNINDDSVEVSYNFIDWPKELYSVRIGNITLINGFNSESSIISFSNGGSTCEDFIFNKKLQHNAPVSTIVSSSMGIGATTGIIGIKDKNKYLQLQWDPSECAVMPLLQNIPTNPESFSRVIFSVRELDESSKISDKFGSFSMKLST